MVLLHSLSSVDQFKWDKQQRSECKALAYMYGKKPIFSFDLGLFCCALTPSANEEVLEVSSQLSDWFGCLVWQSCPTEICPEAWGLLIAAAERRDTSTPTAGGTDLD